MASPKPDLKQIAKDLELLDRNEASNICYGDAIYAHSLIKKHNMDISAMRELLRKLPKSRLRRASDMLVEASGHPVKQNPWKPIASAPTDYETKVDLWIELDEGGFQRVTDCRRSTTYKGHWFREEWAGTRNCRHVVTRVFLVQPTHWMYSPDAPE